MVEEPMRNYMCVCDSNIRLEEPGVYSFQVTGTTCRVWYSRVTPRRAATATITDQRTLSWSLFCFYCVSNAHSGHSGYQAHQ